MPAFGSDMDALLGQQPKDVSPYSWAQGYQAENLSRDKLMQQMMTEITMRKMADDASLERTKASANLTNDNAVKIAQIGAGSREKVAQMQIDADTTPVSMDPDTRVIPAAVIKTMTPSQQRRFQNQFDVVSIDRKGNVTAKAKKSQNTPTQTPGQPAPIPGGGNFQSVRP